MSPKKIYDSEADDLLILQHFIKKTKGKEQKQYIQIFNSKINIQYMNFKTIYYRYIQLDNSRAC